MALKFKTNQRILLFIFSALIPFLILNIKASALNLIPSNIYNIDTALLNQVDNYNQPDSIYIVPITMEADAVIQDSDWYEGLFYYQASKLNQGDFLSHYFITKDGQVLQGNHKGDEQRFIVKNSSEKPVIITYLSAKDQSDFTLEVRNVLKNTILEIANNNAIKLNKVSLRSVSVILKEGEPVSQEFSVLNGKMELTLKELIKEITPLYKPVTKSYQLMVEKVDNPTGQVNPGETVDVNITIKNNSSLVLYQGSTYEPLISKMQNVTSKFYLNGVWLSQTQGPVMTDGSTIKPGESKTFPIKVKVPLYFGEQTEQFQLINTLGNIYLGTSFNIKLNIKHPDKEVVEITQTETGQLNVRNGPWYSSEIVGKVTPGQRFIVLEKTDSGYLKLDLGNGKTGWVVVKYTKQV